MYSVNNQRKNWCFAWDNDPEFQAALNPTWDSIPLHDGWAENDGWTAAVSGRKKKRRDARIERKVQSNEWDIRTVFFTAEEKRQVEATCERNNVRGLRNGQWSHGDGTIHDTGHTLPNGRCGEIAGAIIFRAALAEDPRYAGWTVEGPDFENRTGFERDRGDLLAHGPEGQKVWIEVKTITNHGGYNKQDINNAGHLGYVFQRLKWTFETKQLELSATFDPTHGDYNHAMNSLLIGVVCTKLKGGGLALTVSKSVFLEPIHTREWVKLRYTSKEDEGLKRATIDPCVV